MLNIPALSHKYWKTRPKATLSFRGVCWGQGGVGHYFYSSEGCVLLKLLLQETVLNRFFFSLLIVQQISLQQNTKGD